LDFCFAHNCLNGFKVAKRFARFRRPREITPLTGLFSMASARFDGG
jgi:hypothetical protein